MHYAERELFRYTKGSVREHNLLKNQFVHTKFLLNRKNPTALELPPPTGTPSLLKKRESLKDRNKKLSLWYLRFAQEKKDKVE